MNFKAARDIFCLRLKMRILFIYPNLHAQIGFNYGIAYLSAVLRQQGHVTGLLNVNESLGYPLDIQRIIHDVKAFSPDLVGFSVVTNQLQYALRIARAVRGCTDAPFVCGGIHATVAPSEVLATGLFDYACVGEGEEALADLAHALERHEDTSRIQNLWLRRDGTIVKNRVRPFISVENLPPKDYEIFDFQKMIDAKDGWVGVMASRGCPFRCTYCFNHRLVNIYQEDTGLSPAGLNYIRHHPVDEVIGELEYLLGRYKGIRMFIFDDDLFTFRRDYVHEFCQAYKERIPLPFVCNAHVKVFDHDIAGSLRRAGCRIVKFGLESGSERVRKEILNRPMSNADIIRAFRAAHESGLHTSAFVMIGLPGESIEDLFATIDLLATIKPGRFRWSIFFPYAGTVAHELARQKGLIDFHKMQGLSNFTDESCLDFGEDHNLLIEKLAAAYPWFVNERAGFPSSATYRELVSEIEGMDRRIWEETKGTIRSRDKEVSARLTQAGKIHYAIKYNDFMGVRSDWSDP
ncbi:MAG: B12-binding domain-containing radical SAM protein [Deltaproteobacteria bacterium]|nr:B12-binding domain-containing radical SAM protein [Deltaproteobacteria bacterium]MBW2121913.1 B12-binding domain-containing radical SAM protein [Deltaproteobacteria bacterium]